MADLIKKIKIKKQDGTFTDYIPIGADAVNVETSDGESVELKLNKKPYYYNTVADMKADTKLKAGNVVQTLGYYEENDGGAGLYKIINNSQIVNDEINYIKMNNNMIACLISEEVYLINSNYTEDMVQSIFNIERPKTIIFTSDFTFTKTMRLNANTTINLSNNTLIFNIPKVTENWRLSHGFFNFKDTDEFLEYNGNGNICIEGGTIIGGNCSFCHAKNITIKNIYFKNCLNDHVLELPAINGLVVENCIFEGHPIQSDTTVRYKEMIQIDQMTSGGFPHFSDSSNPTYDSTPNKNWTIKNNQFIRPDDSNFSFYVAIGSHAYTGGIYHENFTITNNSFYNMYNMAIHLINVKNITIESNEFIKDIDEEIELKDLIKLTMIWGERIVGNIKISNNKFDGNSQALLLENPTLMDSNIDVEYNVFQNYNYWEKNDNQAIVFFNGNLNSNFNYNILKGFNQNAIRYFGVRKEPYIHNTEGNTFIVDTALAQPLIKCYAHICNIINNIFDYSVLPKSNTTVFVLGSSTDSIVDVFMKGNLYSQNLLNTEVDTNLFIDYQGNAQSYKNIYGIIEKIKIANINSLTNESTIYPIFNYNKLILVLGSGANTQTIPLKAFTIWKKIDARTYKLPVITNSNTNSYVIFTINNDGTFSYDGTTANLNFRTLYGVNE